MTMADRTTPVDPFGATVDGVNGLVPEARLLDTAPAVGQYGITVDQVYAWVQELTGVVAMTLDKWQRLAVAPVAPETTSDRDQLIDYARTVIHNGAGSYLEAARHPERAAPNDTSYAAVLWARYTTGLDRLAAWLERRLAEQQPADEPTPQAGEGGGTAYNFPGVTVPDYLLF